MTMRINNIDDLPEAKREQARKKMGQLCTAAAAMKYHNIKTEVDGHVFDSRREAERYGELRLLYAARQIAVLMIQVPFPLTGGIMYIADFVYYDLARKEFIVEDAKGVKTKEYLLKKILMREIGIEIQEV
jgi:hypothetical protein